MDRSEENEIIIKELVNFVITQWHSCPIPEAICCKKQFGGNECAGCYEQYIRKVVVNNAVNRKRDTVVFDFDGVIHSYISGWQGEAFIPDMPVPGIQKALKDISANGYEIVVVSTRCNSDAGIKAVNDYLKRFGLAQYISRVCKEKPPAICYVDDRSICFDGNPETLLEKIKTFKSWIERSLEERNEKTEQSGMKSDGKDDEKWKIQKQEFEAAIKPIHEWICKYGNPYTTVVVAMNGATVHEEYIAAPLPIPD